MPPAPQGAAPAPKAEEGAGPKAEEGAGPKAEEGAAPKPAEGPAPTTGADPAKAKVHEQRLAAEKEPLNADAAADVAEAAKMAPNAPRWTIVQLTKEVEYYAERGMGKWIAKAQAEGRVHYLAREDLVATFGESVGGRLWAEVKPGTRGMHFKGHVFVKRGLSLPSASSVLVHEVTHWIQLERLPKFQSTFQSEFQSRTMQQRYLQKLPPAQVDLLTKELKELLRSDPDALAEMVYQDYHEQEFFLNDDDVDKLIKQITDNFGTI
jgi:hypothetical protein